MWSVLITLASVLIDNAEKIFTKPKAGADRKSAVRNALRAFLDKMLVTEVIKKEEQPTDDALDGLIETVFSEYKNRAPISVPANPNITNELWVVRGTVSKIN